MQHAKHTVAQRVIDYLRDNIENGTWSVGDKIPSENELTKTLGVSRVSARLAIQQFIALGVMRSHHGKGTFIISDNVDALSSKPNGVSPTQCRDIEKILEYRAIVEPEAAFLAAQSADAKVLGALRTHLDDLVASIGESEEFVKHDLQFHIEIARASGNPVILQSLRDVFQHTQSDHKRINTLFGFKDGVYYHSLILKAFESDDPKRARKIMSEHLLQALEQIKRD